MLKRTKDGIDLGFTVGKGTIGVVISVTELEGLREVLDGTMVEFGDAYQMLRVGDWIELAGPGIALRAEMDWAGVAELLNGGESDA